MTRASFETFASSAQTEDQENPDGTRSIGVGASRGALSMDHLPPEGAGFVDP